MELPLASFWVISLVAPLSLAWSFLNVQQLHSRTGVLHLFEPQQNASDLDEEIEAAQRVIHD